MSMEEQGRLAKRLSIIKADLDALPDWEKKLIKRQ